MASFDTDNKPMKVTEPHYKERKIRLYANHLALTVRRHRRGRSLDLFERYEPKRKIGGPFQSWIAVEEAIERYGESELKRLTRKTKP